MESLEIQLLDEWFKNLKRWGTYNRKWWPKLEDAKRIALLCNIEQPMFFIEVGTGNGITASYVAAYGIKVLTFDPADRPKVYLDESFPLKNLHKTITYVNLPIEEGINHWTSNKKVVWSIDGLPGEKSIASYLKTIRLLPNKGDLILLNGVIERV
jgi:hypothetical protein